MQKYFHSRIANITDFGDLVKILSESTPLIAELTEDFQEQIKLSSQNQNGSLILSWKKASGDVPIAFTAWLGKATLRPLINIDARKFFMSMIGIEQAQIDEACDKIKLEDQLNSKKSLETNPQYKAKLAEAAQNTAAVLAADQENDEHMPGDNEKAVE